jgi:2'-5' RNA ligase
MQGIVSLLPEPFYTHVTVLWDELCDQHGLTGVRVTPYPHFSWQIGQNYPPQALEEAMQAIATEISPLPISTAGLGLFTGPAPVLYIPVVKTSALFELHTQIWQRFSQFGQGVNSNYHPNAWMPHITLAHLDLTPANIGSVIGMLSHQNTTWDMIIDNIAYIHQSRDEAGELKMRYELRGNRFIGGHFKVQ